IDAQGESPPRPAPSVVYFVQVGKHIKIGFTTNLDRRLKIRLLATISGGRELEQRLHCAFSETRIRGEFFHCEWRLNWFIELVSRPDLAGAWKYLEDTSPARIAQRNIQDRQRRVAERRKTKAEEDAYYAGLVAERKRRLGW